MQNTKTYPIFGQDKYGDLWYRYATCNCAKVLGTSKCLRCRWRGYPTLEVLCPRADRLRIKELGLRRLSKAESALINLIQ